jgi:hypothetical protein
VSPRHSLARLRALCPAERRLLARALLLLPAYAAGVRIGGLRRARAWFSRLGAIEGATPAQAVRMVALAVRRLPWRPGCLPASLTLQRILAAQGVDSQLRLGVRKVAGRLEAHAWLERAGERLIDTRAEDERFAVLERVAAGR